MNNARPKHRPEPVNLLQANLFVEDFASMLPFYRDAPRFQTSDIDSRNPFRW